MSGLVLTGFLQLPYGSVDTLWRLGDPGAALLYLFVLRHSRMPLPGEAEQAGLSAAGLQRARRALEEGGLLSPQLLAAGQAEAAPAYTSQDIAQGLQQDTAFAALRMEVERMLGRVLSSEDLKTLYSIYDWRGLPAQVLYLLVQGMTEEYKARFGEGSRPPTLRQIDKEAALWEREGLLTLEAAERFVAAREQRTSKSGKLYRVLGIAGRAASATEKRYVEKWAEQGLSPELVAEGYDRTLVNTGKLSWAYLDKILQNWYLSGLLTPEEVRKKDHPAGMAPLAARSAVPRVERSNRPIAPPGPAELANLQRLMNRRKREAASDES